MEGRRAQLVCVMCVWFEHDVMPDSYYRTAALTDQPSGAWRVTRPRRWTHDAVQSTGARGSS